jgi:uncharacterized protein YycO
MGDVIFRSGTAFESRMARMLDGDTRYSHAGVLDLSDVPHVVHVVPGSGTGNLVRREALADFLAPEAAEAYAVFRVRADYRVQARHAAAAARRFYATRLPFDALFSLTSADELYCSELVWRAYLSAGLDLLEGRADRSFTGPVIRLSSLQQSRLVSRVY